MTNRTHRPGFNVPPAEHSAAGLPQEEIAVVGRMAIALGQANTNISPAPKAASEAALADLGQFFDARFGDKYPPKPQN